MLQRLKASLAAIGPPGKINEPSIASKGICPRTIVTQPWTLCRSILSSRAGYHMVRVRRSVLESSDVAPSVQCSRLLAVLVDNGGTSDMRNSQSAVHTSMWTPREYPQTSSLRPRPNLVSGISALDPFHHHAAVSLAGVLHSGISAIDSC